MTLLQIQVLNTNLTDNLGEDNPSLQYESRCSNIQIIIDILWTALEGSVNQAAYQLQQNLGGGVETRPPRVEFWPEVGGRPGEVGDSTPQPSGNSNIGICTTNM